MTEDAPALEGAPLSDQLKKFTLDVGWGLASSVITLFVGFLLSIFIARWLGAEDLGLYRMMVTIQSFASLLATFGIPVALVKFASEYKDDQQRYGRAVTSALFSSVVFGIITGAVLYGVSSLLAGVFTMPGLEALLRILAISFPFVSFSQTVTGLLNGMRDMKKYTVILAFQSGLLAVLIIALVALGYGVEGAAWGIVLSSAGVCGFGAFTARKYLTANFRRLRENTWRMVSFSSRLFSANAVNILVNQSDIVLIGYFMSQADVGFYGIAVALSTFLVMLPQAIQTITFPASSEYWVKNDRINLQRMLDKSMKYSALFMFPAGLLLGFFSRDLVKALYGQEFIPAALPLCVLLVARVLRGGTLIPIGSSFTAIGRPGIALNINIAVALLNIVLNIVLIPPYGITGAAIATTIALVAGSALSLVLINRMLLVCYDIRWYAGILMLSLAALGLFAGGTYLLNHFIVGGIIIVALVLLLFRFFITRDEKATIRALALSVIRRS